MREKLSIKRIQLNAGHFRIFAFLTYILIENHDLRKIPEEKT